MISFKLCPVDGVALAGATAGWVAAPFGFVMLSAFAGTGLANATQLLQLDAQDGQLLDVQFVALQLAANLGTAHPTHVLGAGCSVFIAAGSFVVSFYSLRMLLKQSA